MGGVLTCEGPEKKRMAQTLVRDPRHARPLSQRRRAQPPRTMSSPSQLHAHVQGRGQRTENMGLQDTLGNTHDDHEGDTG